MHRRKTFAAADRRPENHHDSYINSFDDSLENSGYEKDGINLSDLSLTRKKGNSKQDQYIKQMRRQLGHQLRFKKSELFAYLKKHPVYGSYVPKESDKPYLSDSDSDFEEKKVGNIDTTLL